ncbi:HAD-like domain-containing protein [Auriculariales sp. MPI-PUGE-AT-0066]|nr:HAD-like domain-containing protein [Auriculariales sp. MPI-PUGE-AT-0066]
MSMGVCKGDTISENRHARHGRGTEQDPAYTYPAWIFRVLCFPSPSSPRFYSFIISQASESMSRVVAVDLDDVLAQTNSAACAWHNDTYGTDMTLSSFYYYHWWKNPLWGSPKEALMKSEAFYRSSKFADLAPVPGAVAGVNALRAMGVRLAIVTARDASQRDLTTTWVKKHFNDAFDGIYFTGELATLKGKWNSGQVISGGKAAVIHALGARILIDDSVENAFQCAEQQIETLVFGNYAWNQRRSLISNELDRISFARRRELDANNWWETDLATLPPQAHRVVDWNAVVSWVRDHPNRM